MSLSLDSRDQRALELLPVLPESREGAPGPWRPAFSLPPGEGWASYLFPPWRVGVQARLPGSTPSVPR